MYGSDFSVITDFYSIYAEKKMKLIFTKNEYYTPFIFYSEKSTGLRGNIWDDYLKLKKNKILQESNNKIILNNIQSEISLKDTDENEITIYTWKMTKIHQIIKLTCWNILRQRQMMNNKQIIKLKGVELANCIKALLGRKALQFTKENCGGFLRFIERYPTIFYLERDPKNEKVGLRILSENDVCILWKQFNELIDENPNDIHCSYLKAKEFIDITVSRKPKNCINVHTIPIMNPGNISENYTNLIREDEGSKLRWLQEMNRVNTEMNISSLFNPYYRSNHLIMMEKNQFSTLLSYQKSHLIRDILQTQDKKNMSYEEIILNMFKNRSNFA